MSSNFIEDLCCEIKRKKSNLCVGIDPVYDRLPAELKKRKDPISAIEIFCKSVLEAVQGSAAVIKFQSACFERYRGKGFDLLFELSDFAHKLGLLTIADVKRGDIAESFAHYGEAFLKDRAFDAMTASPFMGPDTVKTICDIAVKNRAGVFFLVRTSNPQSGVFQTQTTDGVPFYERVACEVYKHFTRTTAGYMNCGFVVGATHRDEGLRIRAKFPDVVFLIPGYGAQGATAEDLKGMYGRDSAGAIVNSSREIIFAYEKAQGSWRESIANAARKSMRELTQAAL